ncbi:hypothetical protein HMN09_00851900 [Mycena chlorophos]|uniref:Uncharacterized protein n=1 Tax=Mycena chlorophos TaxID=658473 RepID=A0A8H6SV50_MYCCL|nr:hypothetical protein HMN09_00851900 [Mycena chlorophos]
MGAPTSPILPPELEHRIFYIAAYSAPYEACTLMLVAWRVKEWVEPLLYRSLIIGAKGGFSSSQLPHLRREPAMKMLRSKPAGYLAKRVENLIIVSMNGREHASGLSPADFRDIISSCLGVRSLVVFNLLHTAGTLHGAFEPLKRLEQFDGDFGVFFDCHPPAGTSTKIDFANDASLSRLTHLILGDQAAVQNPDAWRELLRLPSLTHLAVGHHSGVVTALRASQREALLAAMAPSGKPEIAAFVVLYYGSTLADAVDDSHCTQEFHDWLGTNPGFVGLESVWESGLDAELGRRRSWRAGGFLDEGR